MKPFHRTFNKTHPPHYPLLFGIILVGLLSACSSTWVPVEQVVTPSATVISTATLTEVSPTLPLPSEDTPFLTAADTATPSPSATLTLQPTQTVTPLSPENQLATFYAEATQTANPGGTPGKGPRPTATRVPTRTPTSTKTPTITPTPLPPFALLRLARPGALSKVVSPLHTQMFVRPGDDGRVQIDLIGEDGRFITRQLLDYPHYLGKQIGISPEIAFEIRAVAETSRLVISIRDKFNRMVYLSSVELILLSIGNDELQPAGEQLEPYIVREPKPEAIISGGKVHLSGLARPVNDNPIILELIDVTGQVVGSQQIKVNPPSGDLSHTPFNIDIPYTVQDITPVRLTIHQESSTRIAGTVALSSLELILAP